MVMPLLAALALAAQPSAPTGEADAWLIADCSLARFDPETLLPANERVRFGLLLRVPEAARGRVNAASIRVFDPGFLLGGVRLASASFSANGHLLSAQSAANLPIVYRLTAEPSSEAGVWGANLRMNGRTAAGERWDHAYIGQCTMSQPGDAVAQFEALGNSQ